MFELKTQDSTSRMKVSCRNQGSLWAVIRDTEQGEGAVCLWTFRNTAKYPMNKLPLQAVHSLSDILSYEIILEWNASS